jgi:hypothetical protein
MAIKWSLLRDRLLRVLDDVERDAATYGDDDLRDYVNEALVAIAAHTAQEKVYSLTLDASASELALPDDVLELGPVLATYGTSEKYLYKPYKLKPGESLPTVSAGSAGSSLSYYRWGDTLKLLAPIPSGRTVSIHYYGYWDRVDEETDTLAISRWMEEAVKWYALHAAMAKPARNTANLRQYNTSQEQGNPEHNPLLKFAKFCLERYETLMIEHPQQLRTGWEGR